MNIFTTLDRRQRRNLGVLFTAGLLFWSSLASLLPVLPLYLRDLGGSEQQIGLVMGAFAVGVLLCRAWVGRLADQRSRKLALLLGLLAATIAPLCYIVVKTMPLMGLSRALHGISIAAFTTGYSALVVDLSPERNRGELIGYMSLVNPLGMAIGPALGGFLEAWTGYTPLFLLSAGLGLVGLVCTWQVEEQPLAPSIALDSAATSSKQFWRLLTSPRVRIPALVMLMVGLVFGALSTYVPLFIEQEQVSLNAGLFYTAIAIGSFVVRFITGRASDRHGRGLFISLSLVCYALSMLLLSLANSAEAFLIAGTVEGLGAGILLPTMSALVADRASPLERARLFSLCIGGFDLGIALAGPLLGTVAAQASFRAMFALAATLAGAALLIFMTQAGKDLRHSLRFALGRGQDVYAYQAPEPELVLGQSQPLSRH
ncbi:MFS transporter [Leptolyngbya sp. FACHB-261]|uniref:MFS transporter n=1 Tax=Leptolyngbya sp. FACHB-261 TaxID=2692806 RepID=UPI001688FD85|nr:MFS transporter [Leptolyngbya sp. FACHB-261]MBD2104540.1 MFS transporter [Leptolyngbya sp. FACHB-261]